MISRHHYPDRIPGEPRPAWEQNPTPDDYTRIAAALDAEDAADRAAGVDLWDRVFPPPAPGVCDCDEPAVTVEFGPVTGCPLVRDNRGNAVDIGEPWSPRVVKALGWLVFWTACLSLGWLCGGWLGGAL